ncbi:hypothetical protein GLYMA_08G118051v4 [Glycine max]|nr:hypothetical protein GLYMA_08G118051v4 [Glycine max]KAH1050792.1 hypothetical protein GYH30_020976 [Glycine max]
MHLHLSFAFLITNFWVSMSIYSVGDDETRTCIAQD